MARVHLSTQFSELERSLFTLHDKMIGFSVQYPECFKSSQVFGTSMSCSRIHAQNQLSKVARVHLFARFSKLESYFCTLYYQMIGSAFNIRMLQKPTTSMSCGGAPRMLQKPSFRDFHVVQRVICRRDQPSKVAGFHFSAQVLVLKTIYVDTKTDRHQQ